MSDKLTTEEVEQEKSLYTRKIHSPLYEPRDVMPHISELFDTTKRDELIREIKNDNLPKELEAFLISAAERHVAFNFSKIADYYAHLPYKYKKHFEDSALVIIDYDKAIRDGFVTYEKELDISRIEYLENVLTEEKMKENRDSKREKVMQEELDYLKDSYVSDEFEDEDW